MTASVSMMSVDSLMSKEVAQSSKNSVFKVWLKSIDVLRSCCSMLTMSQVAGLQLLEEAAAPWHIVMSQTTVALGTI